MEAKVTKPFQILGILLAGSLLASAQVGSLSDNDRKALVRTSSVIVVAVPEPETGWIVNRPKMEARRASSLIVDPSDYVVGRLINARVVEILKADASVKKGEVLKLFVNGWQDPLDAGNIVVPGQKSILFLSTLNESDPRLKDVGLYLLPAKNSEILPFALSNLYEPTGEAHSVVAFTPSFLKTIQHDIRALARAHPKD
jgi:hypothetical protein